DESRVGVAVDERRARVQVARGQEIDWKDVPGGFAQDPVEAWVVRVAPPILPQEDADTDRAGRLLPVCDCLRYRWVIRVDRLDDGQPAGMRPLHLHRIAG